MPWIQFEFNQTQIIGKVVIHNREDCCEDRLFPFEILIEEKSGKIKRCRENLYDIGDPQIPSNKTNPIEVICGKNGKTGKFMKLVGHHAEKVLNLCEVEVYRATRYFFS